MRTIRNLNLVVFAGSFSMFYYETEKDQSFSDVCQPGFFANSQARPGDIVYVKANGKTYQTRILKDGTIENMAAASADPETLVNDALIKAVAERLAKIAEEKSSDENDNIVFENIPDVQMLVVKEEAAASNFKSLSDTMNDILATLRAAKIIDDGEEE